MRELALILIVIIFCIVTLQSQNIVISDDDSYTAHPSAMLDVKSLDKGLLVPRMSAAQRIAVTAPAAYTVVPTVPSTPFT